MIHITLHSNLHFTNKMGKRFGPIFSFERLPDTSVPGPESDAPVQRKSEKVLD